MNKGYSEEVPPFAKNLVGWTIESVRILTEGDHVLELRLSRLHGLQEDPLSEWHEYKLVALGFTELGMWLQK